MLSEGTTAMGGGCPVGALSVLVLLAHHGELDEERGGGRAAEGDMASLHGVVVKLFQSR